MVRKLREQRFDAAVIFSVFSQNPLPAAFLCHLADIPLRLAYCRENPYHVLTHWVPDPEPRAGIRHEVQRQLDLVRPSAAVPRDERFSLRVPAQARRRVNRLLQTLPMAPGRPASSSIPAPRPSPGATLRSSLPWSPTGSCRTWART